MLSCTFFAGYFASPLIKGDNNAYVVPLAIPASIRLPVLRHCTSGEPQ